MDIAFPLKGLDTNSAYNTDYDGSSPSLVNALPYDRDFILRGAIRPGLSKFSETQMGSGSPVLFMGQVTRALDPSTLPPTPDTTILNYTFAGVPDTTRVNVVDINPADTSADWIVRYDSGFGSDYGLELVGDHLKVQSGYVRSDLLNSSHRSAAVYAPALSLGNRYIIRATIIPVTNADDGGVGILGRINKAAPDLNGFAFLVNQHSCSMRVFSSVVTATFDTDLAESPQTIEVKVYGDVIEGWVNGVKYVTKTSSSNASYSGIGFNIGKDCGDGTGLQEFRVFTVEPLAIYRETDLVFQSGGDLYVAAAGSDPVASTNGTGILSDSIKPQGASFGSIMYMVDGNHDVITLDTSSNTAGTLTVSAGSETSTTLGKYQAAAMWRGRLVLANAIDNPQNFVMSRQGDPTDWDYTQEDVGAAIVGNDGTFGTIGDPLNAVMPWTEDVLVLGGDHTIYLIEGDLANGGQITPVSTAVGTLGPNGWTVDPSGNLYFIGTGGLFMMPRGSKVIQNLASGKVLNYFTNVNRTTAYYQMAWDRDRNGLWLMQTLVNTGESTHMFWSQATQGFFPIRFPDAHGPMSSMVFDGDGPTDRSLLLGGRDGYVRMIDNAAVNDDGTGITSYAVMGPFRPAGPAALAVLEALEVFLGDPPTGFTASDFAMNLTLQTGKDANTALFTPERTLTFAFTSPQRRKRLLQRLSGGTFYVTVASVADKVWSLEKFVALFIEGGLQRRY